MSRESFASRRWRRSVAEWRFTRSTRRCNIRSTRRTFLGHRRRAAGGFFGFLACCCSTSSASCFVASFVAVSCRQETLKSNNRYHLGFFLRISLHTDAFGLPNQVNMGMKGPPKTRVALYMAKVKGQAFTPTRHELVLSGVCLLKPTLPSMLDVVLCSSGP